MGIREIRPEDAPALSALWQRVFEDPPACSETFLRLLPDMGSGVAAFEDGRPLGAAYIVTACHLREGEKSRRCGYLYAVAVAPEARRRGLGAALSQAAAALGRARGAEIICTRPAEDELFAWYERVLGARCVLRLASRDFASAPGLPVCRLDPAAYGKRREALLAGRPHLALEPAAMAFEEANLRIYGGGLFAVGDGLAAACAYGDAAELTELLGVPDEAAAAVGDFFGVPWARLWQSAPEGKPFAAAVPAALPPDTLCGLLFD